MKFSKLPKSILEELHQTQIGYPRSLTQCLFWPDGPLKSAKSG